MTKLEKIVEEIKEECSKIECTPECKFYYFCQRIKEIPFMRTVAEIIAELNEDVE